MPDRTIVKMDKGVGTHKSVVKRTGNLFRIPVSLVTVIVFVLVLIAMCVLVSGLTGCTLRGNGAGDAGKDDGKFTIVTSFYPVYLTTINITRDIPNVEVINLTQPQTGCLHDYQLKPNDIVTLQKADAFVVNGAGMEAFLDKAVSQINGLKIVDSSKGINLLKDSNGVANPHVWLSAVDVVKQTKNIAEQLGNFDPNNKTKYLSNAVKYELKLLNLFGDFKKRSSGIKQQDIITFHEAFPYFAADYGLRITAVIERNPGVPPTPMEIENTIGIIREHKIKALFAEPQYSPKAAEVISQETGAKIYTLDPIVTGDATPDAFDDYINKMRENMQTLEKALG